MTRLQKYAIVSLAFALLFLHSRSPLSKLLRSNREQSEVSNRQMPRPDSAATSQDSGWSLRLTRSRPSQPTDQQGEVSGRLSALSVSGFSVIAVNSAKQDGTVITRTLDSEHQVDVSIPRLLRNLQGAE